MFEQVGKGAGNNATITVPLCAAGDGEGLTTACLAIGKYGPIIARQYTVQKHILETSKQHNGPTDSSLTVKILQYCTNFEKQHDCKCIHPQM